MFKLRSPFHRTDSVETASVSVRELCDLRGQVAAIQKPQAVVEFNLDGTILAANSNFLAVVGIRR